MGWCSFNETSASPQPFIFKSPCTRVKIRLFFKKEIKKPHSLFSKSPGGPFGLSSSLPNFPEGEITHLLITNLVWETKEMRAPANRAQGPFPRLRSSRVPRGALPGGRGRGAGGRVWGRASSEAPRKHLAGRRGVPCGRPAARKRRRVSQSRPEEPRGRVTSPSRVSPPRPRPRPRPPGRFRALPHILGKFRELPGELQVQLKRGRPQGIPTPRAARRQRGARGSRGAGARGEVGELRGPANARIVRWHCTAWPAAPPAPPRPFRRRNSGRSRV